jgi:hypothetical protein
MSTRLTRSIAITFLAAAPLLLAAPSAPAHAATAPATSAVQPSQLDCDVVLDRETTRLSTTATVTVTCDATQTLDITIRAGDQTLLEVQRTFEAGVTESVSVTVPRISANVEICADLRSSNGNSETQCG